MMETPESAGTTTFAVLPLRDIVVFPHMIVPLFVGRDKSVRALEHVMKDDSQILLVAQKNASQDDPGTDDIYRVGTLGSVLQLLKLLARPRDLRRGRLRSKGWARQKRRRNRSP